MNALVEQLNGRMMPGPEEFKLQDGLLEGVSRTFALTIPALPDSLHRVVGNAYLLCRIVDTIEDEPSLAGPDRRRFAEMFVAAVDGDENADQFAEALSPRLSTSTLPAERALIEKTSQVLDITRSFSQPQQAALQRCVAVMAEGMVSFQENRGPAGLSDQREMDRYCYHVAGVVGEMLTELFCLHLPERLGPRRDEMMALGRSFGQGLQMTNILKDVWADWERGYCWLPADVFTEEGYDLRELSPDNKGPAFEAAMLRLVAVAHGHLANALEYTLKIPSRETGIRNFCLWALGMAVLTLRRIADNPGYGSGAEVKISRRSVSRTVILSKFFARQDFVLRWLFARAGAAVPRADITPE
jgi:farnesyl-diphosphate farnesyltransferase